jgi:hypothetical protein
MAEPPPNEAANVDHDCLDLVRAVLALELALKVIFAAVYEFQAQYSSELKRRYLCSCFFHNLRSSFRYRQQERNVGQAKLLDLLWLLLRVLDLDKAMLWATYTTWELMLVKVVPSYFTIHDSPFTAIMPFSSSI